MGLAAARNVIGGMAGALLLTACSSGTASTAASSTTPPTTTPSATTTTPDALPGCDRIPQAAVERAGGGKLQRGQDDAGLSADQVTCRFTGSTAGVADITVTFQRVSPADLVDIKAAMASKGTKVTTVPGLFDEAFTTEGKLTGGGTMTTLIARKGSLGVTVMASGAPASRLTPLVPAIFPNG